jgi:hypothetical protein
VPQFKSRCNLAAVFFWFIFSNVGSVKKYSLKFYGIAPDGKSGLFKFKVNNRADALAALKRFQLKNWAIRAAYLDCRLQNGIRYSNERIA